MYRVVGIWLVLQLSSTHQPLAQETTPPPGSLISFSGIDIADLLKDSPDLDNDGVPSLIDNCPDIANHDQLDSDGNGVGDVCNFIEVAKLDLVERISPDNPHPSGLGVSVVRIDSIVWQDSCLGFPERGELCISPAVPGYKLVLQSARPPEQHGKQYLYHTDLTSKVRYIKVLSHK